MRLLETDIRIAASREIVWDILTRFDDYGRWNPFIRAVRGEFVPGARLSVLLHTPGRRAMRFHPRITVLEPRREFRWLGHIGVPGMLDGEHRFLVERISDDAVRFVQEERFRGALVASAWKKLDRYTRRGFEQMNAALKLLSERAERLGTVTGPIR